MEKLEGETFLSSLEQASADQEVCPGIMRKRCKFRILGQGWYELDLILHSHQSPQPKGSDGHPCCNSPVQGLKPEERDALPPSS